MQVNIIVSGLHLKNHPELEEYATKKATRLAKYNKNILEIRVRLIAKEAHRGKENDYYCEIEVDLPGKNLEVVDSERAMDKAIDKAIERMKRVIVKHKEKSKDKIMRNV